MKAALVMVMVALAAAQEGDDEVGSGVESQSSNAAAWAELETNALLAFKASADQSGGSLSSWKRGGDPCGGDWIGVSCFKGRVSKLVLEEAALVGGIDALLGLRALRLLSLKNNALNGSLPRELGAWGNVKFVFLAGNRLSGSLPKSIAQLSHLWRLDLAHNLLSGPIPSELDALSNLLTLRLEDNRLSETLPSLAALSMLNDFNVSGNQLRGSIPKSLERFDASTFAGNDGLCGLPLRRCGIGFLRPAPAPSPSVATPPPSPTSSSSSSSSHAYVPSPLAMPSRATPPDAGSASATAPRDSHGRREQQQLSTGAIVAIVVGDAAVLLLITSVFLVFYWRKCARRQAHSRSSSSSSASQMDLDRNKPLKGSGGEQRSSSSAVSLVTAANSSVGNRLVFADQSASFDLEHLLRASAEMLGKGSLGSAYKAVLEDGTVVAVKRLKDVASGNRKDFEQHMELIARMRSPHLVQLKAYYYAKDEKLLVYDYMPNASLHTLLHGNRGPGRVPLDWTTRMKIAAGVARGLAYIHRESGSHKIPHGNIKSSNVFLDRNGVVCIGDFGLALLMNSAACSRLLGYRAPEHSDTRRISHKGDVYSFGVLLLEILTGKAPVQQDGVHDLPRWVQSVVREEWTAEVFDLELMRYKNIEEEMVALLQTAMACVAHSPDARPRMSHVVRMIEEIRDVCDESFESPSHHSSSLSET